MVQLLIIKKNITIYFTRKKHINVIKNLFYVKINILIVIVSIFDRKINTVIVIKIKNQSNNAQVVNSIHNRENYKVTLLVEGKLIFI